MDLIFAGLLTFAALGIVAVVFRWQIGSSRRELPVTTDWIQQISVERYRPMLRLLDGSDIQFLRAQPGYTAEMEAKLRADRAKIFRGYLRSLEADFQRVCSAIKTLMVQSRRDRPDLAELLLRQQILFAWGLVMAEIRLFLFRLGFGTVDVATLVKIFDIMRLELRSLVPAEMSAVA